MGITQQSIKRLGAHDLLKPCKVLILGCQNMYIPNHMQELAYDYFTRLGFEVDVWDVSGCQGSTVVDLRDELEVVEQYDLILDHGTLEHVDGFYHMAHRNVHELCKVGGIIVHENPKSGHWPDHGKNYVTMKFYHQLAELNNYEILEIAEEYAEHNYTDGGNICAVLRKRGDVPFISENTFAKLDFYVS